jgi:hypothetical protein
MINYNIYDCFAVGMLRYYYSKTIYQTLEGKLSMINTLRMSKYILDKTVSSLTGLALKAVRLPQITS